MLKTISLQEYAKRIGCDFEVETIAQVQQYAQDVLDWVIWDYPIDELGYVLMEVHNGCANELVYVETEYGLRICEL